MARPSSPMHGVAWLLWAIAASAQVQMARNPVIVGLVIMVAALVVEAHGSDGPLRRAFPVLVTLGLVFAGLRVVLTGLTAGDAGHPLLTLPDATLPRLLGGFTVGGVVDGQVVAQAAADGLVIVGIMAAFGAFNAVAAHHELLQAAPRAFHETALVITVALAFVPATLTTIARVREADRARTGGRVVRRGRLVRTIVPVLETGMERAVSLAESMDARGLGAGRADRASRVAGIAGLGTLLALAAAFVALIGRSTTGATAALAIAGALLVVAVAAAGNATRRHRHRARPLRGHDVAVVAASVLAGVVTTLLVRADDPTVLWSAAGLTWPDVTVPALLPVVLLAAPLALRRRPTAVVEGAVEGSLPPLERRSVLGIR